MRLVLRFDVDKPYGNHTLGRRILSKFVEETDININLPNYLDQVYSTIFELKNLNIQAIFYFRNCTSPPPDLIESLLQGGHAIGFHAENTCSFESFELELEKFQRKIHPHKIHSFTKHGSGSLKLGRYHFPKYEPEKYIEWSKKFGVNFLFGNGILSEFIKNEDAKYWENCFWLESDYRSKSLGTINELLESEINTIVPIISHPENLKKYRSVLFDLQHLAREASKKGITWMSPDEFLN